MIKKEEEEKNYIKVFPLQIKWLSFGKIKTGLANIFVHRTRILDLEKIGCLFTQVFLYTTLEKEDQRT